MELNAINEVLARLADDRANARDHILSLSKAFIEWMGFLWVEDNKPRLLDFKTLKLKYKGNIKMQQISYNYENHVRKT